MIDQTVLDQTTKFDADVFSDLFKDAHGFRPRMDLSGMDAEALDALWTQTLDALDDTLRREDAMEEMAIANLEQRIADAMLLGAADRETALRWMMQAEGTDEIDYFLWRVGVPSRATTQFFPVGG